MRLIDADELRHSHCVECTLYPDKCLEKDCDWGSIYHIDHAPTVEAIPVEKIQELYNAALEYRDRFKPFSAKWLVANDQAIGIRTVLELC